MNTAMTNPWSSQAHAEFIGNYGFWHKGSQKKVAFIYLLGILRVTREHIREIYDFETDEIQRMVTPKNGHKKSTVNKMISHFVTAPNYLRNNFLAIEHHTKLICSCFPKP